ncbi:MAG TPA: ComEC/Rec2 family competence protein, partial [Anaerolineae bacterium]|nr:ComEC/Rec2 family competence protein [Anaerolineae bacterium]
LTFLNPLILWDVGFQLSFTATLGLILLVPPLERTFFGLLQRLLKTEQVGLVMALLNELLIVTLAAQIITGPLIVYHFGRLSIVSLLTNLLILPVQPPIMIVGGLATLAGMLWLSLGQALGWLVWLPLAWTVRMVELTASLPYASLDLGAFPFWLLVLLYAALGAGVWSAQRPPPQSPPLLGGDGGVLNLAFICLSLAQPVRACGSAGQASVLCWSGWPCWLCQMVCCTLPFWMSARATPFSSPPPMAGKSSLTAAPPQPT